MKAFPQNYKHPVTGLFVEEQGMTLRDWFAGQILPECLIRCNTYSQAAKEAYIIADAMMKVKEKIDE